MPLIWKKTKSDAPRLDQYRTSISRISRISLEKNEKKIHNRFVLFLNYATHIRPISKLRHAKFHWKTKKKSNSVEVGFMGLRCECIWNAEVGTWASLWVYMKRVFMSKMSIQISEFEMNFCSQKMVQENFWQTSANQNYSFFRFLATHGRFPNLLSWSKDKRAETCTLREPQWKI